jgi:hypothetical protein
MTWLARFEAISEASPAVSRSGFLAPRTCGSLLSFPFATKLTLQVNPDSFKGYPAMRIQNR